MYASRTAAIVAAALFVLGACGSSSNAGTAAPATVAPAAPASAAAASVPAPAASVAPASLPAASAVAQAASAPPAGPSLPPTTIDPCALLTTKEASLLADTTLPDATATAANPARLCVRNSTSAIKGITVGVLDASAASDAQVGYQEAIAQIRASQAGIKLIPVSGVGDEADALAYSSSILSIEAIYVRKGKVFFDIVYLAHAGGGPSIGDLENAAKVALGRLP